MKKLNLNKIVQEKVQKVKGKVKQVELSFKAREALEATNKTMGNAFNKIKRKAIRVAPYLALTLPGGVALSKYFSAYNNLLNSQELMYGHMALEQEKQEFTHLLFEQMAYYGKSKEEIINMVGEEGYVNMDKNYARLVEILSQDGNHSFNHILTDAPLVETQNAFGFDSVSELREACLQNNTLAECVSNYMIDISKEGVNDLIEGISTNAPEISLDIGDKITYTVENPYLEKDLDIISEYQSVTNQADFDFRVGNILVAATVAVSTGLYAAERITNKIKQKQMAQTKNQDRER